MLNPVDKEKPTQQPSLHDHRTPSSPKQQLTGSKDKTEESWRTIPVQNQSNGANLSAPHHVTGALPTVAAGTVAATGTPGERGWCWCSCPGWQQQNKGLKEMSSLDQRQGCPWQQWPKRCYRILQSPEINKPARLPRTASTQGICPRQLSWQPGQKKALPLLRSPGENRGAPCACSLSIVKGPQATCLCEPRVKHPSSPSSPWVLKGQWSSWAGWCREDTEYNTQFLQFLRYPGQKDNNLPRDF